MILYDPQSVFAAIAKDPTVRIYQYRQADTHALCYAAFLVGQWEDLVSAPDVRRLTLLYNRGVWTRAGQVWRWSMTAQGQPEP